MDDNWKECVLKTVRPFTALSTERIYNNIDIIQHVVDNKIAGDLIEIGVWKGGSIMSMLLHLQKLGENSRKIHLYDTFTGMTDPSDFDVDYCNVSAQSILPYIKCDSPLEEVQINVRSIGYDPHSIFYHPGDIRENKYIPEKISLLRLDVDWFDSTKSCLEQFYNNVSPGGCIIIDDYNHWKGCKKAVDQFLSDRKEQVQLITIDYTGVYWIKS